MVVKFWAKKKKIHQNTFLISLFSCTPLIWMFHNRKSNVHTNPIHEGAFKIVHQGHDSTSNKLLGIDGSFDIHDCNFQKLPFRYLKLRRIWLPKLWMKFLTSCKKLIVIEIVNHSHCTVWNWRSCVCWLKDIRLYTRWTKRL